MSGGGWGVGVCGGGGGGEIYPFCTMLKPMLTEAGIMLHN